MGQADELRPQPDAEAAALSGLVARAIEGQDAAWGELVGLYARRLFALARSRLRDDHAAEEIVQSVLSTVAIKLTNGGYSEDGRFEPWLFRIAMNRIRDEVRRRVNRPTATDPQHFTALRAQPEPVLEETEHAAASLDRLRAALAQLPDTDRQVIELRHHGQMSFKQMAALLDEPVGTLLARHHRALRKLRTILETDQTDSQGICS